MKGDEVTQNVKTIRTIPLKIRKEGIPAKFEVRGEVFMPKEAFKKLNEQRMLEGEALLANPRNTTSGTLKMQDSSVVAKRNLNCFLYSLLGDDLDFATHGESIKALEDWGFNVSTYLQAL